MKIQDSENSYIVAHVKYDALEKYPWLPSDPDARHILEIDDGVVTLAMGVGFRYVVDREDFVTVANVDMVLRDGPGMYKCVNSVDACGLVFGQVYEVNRMDLEYGLVEIFMNGEACVYNMWRFIKADKNFQSTSDDAVTVDFQLPIEAQIDGNFYRASFERITPLNSDGYSFIVTVELGDQLLPLICNKNGKCLNYDTVTIMNTAPPELEELWVNLYYGPDNGIVTKQYPNEQKCQDDRFNYDGYVASVKVF